MSRSVLLRRVNAVAVSIASAPSKADANGVVEYTHTQAVPSASVRADKTTTTLSVLKNDVARNQDVRVIKSPDKAHMQSAPHTSGPSNKESIRLARSGLVGSTTPYATNHTAPNSDAIKTVLPRELITFNA